MDNLKKTFSRIYDEYIEKIYRFIFLKVNSRETAEDLTSETFLKGWEAFKKTQNPKRDRQSGEEEVGLESKIQKIENPSAFLYRIARNLVIDYYRKKGRTQVVSAEYVQIDDPREDLEEKAILSSDLETIRKTLTDLKEDYQAVITWHYLDDFSISEMAKMLNKSETATRVMLHRALKTLRNKLSSLS